MIDSYVESREAKLTEEEWSSIKEGFEMTSGEVYVIQNSSLSPFANTVMLCSKFHEPNHYVLGGAKLKTHAELIAQKLRSHPAFDLLRTAESKEDFELMVDNLLVEKETITRVQVESSNVVSIGYSDTDEILEVEFSGGGVYQYSEVPPHVYKEFLEASSKGKFFQSVIKGTYKFEKING